MEVLKDISQLTKGCGAPLTSGSTGSCDHRVISNTPIFPKIKTPPDERYADIWNW